MRNIINIEQFEVAPLLNLEIYEGKIDITMLVDLLFKSLLNLIFSKMFLSAALTSYILISTITFMVKLEVIALLCIAVYSTAIICLILVCLIILKLYQANNRLFFFFVSGGFLLIFFVPFFGTIVWAVFSPWK
jgi:hypothetical protein